MLAKELLSRPDDFVTVTCGEKEFSIESIQRKASHANVDDYTMHWTLNVREEELGNIIR